MSHLTHKQHAAIIPRSVPCSAHHLTYGGGCLNCGWEPERIIIKSTPETRAVDLLRELVAELGHASPGKLWAKGHYYSGVECRAVCVIDDEWAQRAIDLIDEIGD